MKKLELTAQKRDILLTPQSLDGPGRLHSLYRSSVNLLLDNGCFCTLFAPIDDEGPWGIILKTKVEFTDPRWQLEKDLPIRAEKGRLFLGGLEVDTAGETFSCAIDSMEHPISPAEALRGLRRLEEPAKLLSAPHCSDVLEHELYLRGEQLKASLLAGDGTGIESAAERLAGLGIGLTPSGDDMLTGCLAALLHCLGAEDFCVNSLRSAMERLTDRTTFISGQMMRAACEGRFRSSLRQLIRALGSDDETGLDAALQAVLAVGATSGYDMLRGVRTAFETLCEETFYAK